MNQEQLVIEQLEIKNSQLGDSHKRLELLLMRWLATGLLVLCALAFILSTYFSNRYPWLEYVKAFSEAGMVGALADWFAVVALFRRPLGLPIPHTALIPASKHRIAENLGDFIKSNFLSPSRVTSQIQSLNIGGRVASYMSTKEGTRVIARHVTALLGSAFKAINHERVANFIQQGLAAQLQKIDLTQPAAGILDLVMRDEAHMQLLDLGVEEIDKVLQSDEAREILLQYVITAFGKYANFDPNDMFAKKAAEKILNGAVSFVREVQRDKKHSFRKGFDKKLKDWVEQLRFDPALKFKANQLRDRMLNSPEVSEYVNRLWTYLSAWVLKDVESQQSVIENQVADVLLDFGTRLDQDDSLKQLINQKIESLVPDLLLRYRDAIGNFISDQIKEWDDSYLVEKLELNVGKDLQFIRLNGTLVGGIVGLLLHCITLIMG